MVEDEIYQFFLKDTHEYNIDKFFSLTTRNINGLDRSTKKKIDFQLKVKKIYLLFWI